VDHGKSVVKLLKSRWWNSREGRGRKGKEREGRGGKERGGNV